MHMDGLLHESGLNSSSQVHLLSQLHVHWIPLTLTQLPSQQEQFLALASKLEQARNIILLQADQGPLCWIEYAEVQFSHGVRWVDDHLKHDNCHTCPKTNERDWRTQPLSENITGYVFVEKDNCL